jgi:hypothetical protein
MAVSTVETVTELGAATPSARAVAHVRLLQTRPWDKVLRGEGAEAARRRATGPNDLDAGPAWLELYLELAEVDEAHENEVYDWFEGSIQPWDDLDESIVHLERPIVHWDCDVREALSRHGLCAPHPGLADPPDATRALALLPHLYALGVNRVEQELARKGVETGLHATTTESNGSKAKSNGSKAKSNGSKANGRRNGQSSAHKANARRSIPEGIALFPIVGFSPVEGSGESTTVCTLRTAVAVIDNVMITLRLPDLPCPDTRRPAGKPPLGLEPSDRATRKPLRAPRRFFPCWDACADDLAEEIARHQAATSRALADRVRESMRECADQLQEELQQDGSANRPAWKERKVQANEKQRVFRRLSQITDMADRQLSRLLRRLGSYGESERRSDGEQAADVRRRYRYALDEIHSLERELTAERDRHRAHMDSESQIERSRFEDMVALVGSAILLPGLIVGIFATNIWSPAKSLELEAFGGLLLLIVGCAVTAIVAIQAFKARKWPPETEHLTAKQHVIVGVLVVVGVTLGLILVST